MEVLLHEAARLLLVWRGTWGGAHHPHIPQIALASAQCRSTNLTLTLTRSSNSQLCLPTMRFGSTCKVAAECKLKY